MCTFNTQSYACSTVSLRLLIFHYSVLHIRLEEKVSFNVKAMEKTLHSNRFELVHRSSMDSSYVGPGSATSGDTMVGA